MRFLLSNGTSTAMPLIVWIAAAMVMVGPVAGAALWISIRRERERLQKFRPRAALLNARAVTLSASRTERLIAPALDALAESVQRVIRPAWISDTELLLERAGPERRLSARHFLAIKAVAIPFGVLIGVAISSGVSTDLRLLSGVALGALLFKLPNLWLNQQAAARSAQITRELPDVLDQITISVTAGLGIEAAMGRVSSRTDGAFALELRRTMQDLRIGIDRTTAFESMARRAGSEDVDHVVSTILQGIEMGVPLAPLLETRATELRRKRRAAAEEKAHKLSVKLTFPTAVCILPALLLVVMGPAVLEIAGGGFSG